MFFSPTLDNDSATTGTNSLLVWTKILNILIELVITINSLSY